MAPIAHISVFLVSSLVIWFFAGLLIESVKRVARRFHKTGFSVAFFVLGFLTSISEISVAINASIGGVPQISVGNLIGASFVILLLIVPLLAIAGKGIELNHTISKKNLALAFAIIILPSLFVIDGDVTRSEGILAILGYLVLFWAIERQYNSAEKLKSIHEEILNTKRVGIIVVAKILLGGGAIFIAAHFLVEQTVYFANLLSVPGSVIGLVVLSIGTNIPELVIATRAILQHRKDIAFGDYLGSAAANTLIFGLLAISSTTFLIQPNEFMSTILLMVAGLMCLYFFALSRHRISRKEGFLLLAFYGVFLVIQAATL